MALTHAVLALTFGLALSAWFRARWSQEELDKLKALVLDRESGRLRDHSAHRKLGAIEGRLAKVERRDESGVVA